MHKPLKPKDLNTNKSQISRAATRLGIVSTGFKTPNSRNVQRRNENNGGVRSSNPNKSSMNLALRENRRSVSPFTMTMTDELGFYEINEILGKGAYGLVKLAVSRKTGQKFAVKIYEKSRLTDPAKRANVNREISILKKISHSNIIRLEKMVENADTVYLFTEFVPGCSLFSYITRQQSKRLAENQCKMIFKQIVCAIAYCHSLKISHRNIKLENILINDSQVKLIDFGFAIANQEKCRTFCGTPSYMAPELVNHKEYNPFCVDVWALGVLLYAMLCGKFPFHEKLESTLYAAITSGRVEIPSSLSEAARDLINKMLCVNAEKREKPEQILQHKWFYEETVDRSVVNYMIKLGHDPRGIDEAVLDKTSYLSVIYDRLCLRKHRGEVL